MAERQAPDDVGDGLRFAPVGFEELEPRRRRGEQVARLDPRARRRGAGFDRALRPVLDDEPQARRRARRPGADFEPRDRGDRGQRLAAEAEGGDCGEIAVRNFRGRVALDGEREVGFVHAAPVVGDADEARPPASIATSIARAPASSAFSTSSLTAAAGRSITSPAAMRSTSSGSRRRIRHGLRCVLSHRRRRPATG